MGSAREAKRFASNRKPSQQDGDGRRACQEELEIADRQRGQNEDIEQVGKEQVPLKDRDDAHDDKGIDNKEEVMIDL